MDDAGETIRQAAKDAAYATPLEAIQPADATMFRDDTFWPYFERLRNEDPVHHAVHEEFGPYWSVMRFEDIMAVDTNHQVFSSEKSITLGDPDDDFQLPMFIAMDPPKHDAQRKTVSPIVSPHNLMNLEPIIRQRAAEILDTVPIGEEFNWVDKVSIELTTMTLAILFDFPWEDRRKLTRWSDVATAGVESGIIESEDQRRAELFECVEYFTTLWDERVNAPPRNDLISMLAHGESTRNMDKFEYLGNLILLIVGGNDTTRNTISGSILALNQNPDQFAKLRADPERMIAPMISETIRWQTPLAYMRRTATQDFQLRDKTIREGDKVAMWYVSGNYDERAIADPTRYDIERERPRHHMSFGFGIHRCVGNRLAELQLKVIWEEILKRFPVIEVTGAPKRVFNSFVRGYEQLPVIIPERRTA
jgi:cytochrome P450